MNGVYDKSFDSIVPEGTVLTENQQEYMKVVAGLFRVNETVRMIDVAKFMNRPTSTVCSAITILSEKGILKTDSKGVITLTVKGE